MLKNDYTDARGQKYDDVMRITSCPDDVKPQHDALSLVAALLKPKVWLGAMSPSNTHCCTSVGCNDSWSQQQTQRLELCLWYDLLGLLGNAEPRSITATKHLRLKPPAGSMGCQGTRSHCGHHVLPMPCTLNTGTAPSSATTQHCNTCATVYT